MNEAFFCLEDGVAPKSIKEAGKKGNLQINTCIGWIDLSEDEFGEVVNCCEYRIKEDK